MTLTDRDRKIVLVLVPIVLLVGYWFLLLSPQREDAATAGEKLGKQERRLQAAQGRLTQLNSARTGFAADYGSLVRLGKAVPSYVDMPTLLVQLDSAAGGTGIKFTKVKTGERGESATPASQGPKAPGTGTGSQGAAAGGQPAQSKPGQAAEGAGKATDDANSKDAQTSSSPKSGGLPVGGGASPSTAPGATAGAAPPGLDTVPLEFEFKGKFYRLADFFHELKRFVRAANDRISVSGRLLTIDSLKFTSTPASFPNLTAEVKATVYLAPKKQGPTAGATQSGPAPPAPATPGPATSPPPTATATP